MNLEQERIARDFLNQQSGKERIATIRTELQSALEAGCGIYRTEESSRTAARRVATLRERFQWTFTSTTTA